MSNSQVSVCVNGRSRSLSRSRRAGACATQPALGALTQAGTASSRFQRKNKCFAAPIAAGEVDFVSLTSVAGLRAFPGEAI